jgi:hypothetical protein
MRFTRAFFPTVLLALALTGCAGGPGGGQSWVRSEVYFGLSKPGGGMVSETEWQAFVDEVVTPKFPAGLSVVDTAGQWREQSGRIAHEPSKMLVLLHPRDAAIEKQIDEIRAEYRRRFNQEAVMKVTTSAQVAF